MVTDIGKEKLEKLQELLSACVDILRDLGKNSPCPCEDGIDSKACVGCEHSEDGSPCGMKVQRLEKEAEEELKEDVMVAFKAGAKFGNNKAKEEIKTDNTETLINALDRIEELEKEKAELKSQIGKMKCCGNCGNERCTSKYRGNSAYHSQSDGYACADNENWEVKK